MGVRSWSERGGRPRDGAAKDGESWSEGEPQRYRGQSRRLASGGRQQSCVRPRRVRRPPPGSESGACLQRGSSGTWESPWSPWVESGGGVPTVEGKTPGAEGKLQPLTRACWRTAKGTHRKRSAARYRGGEGAPNAPERGSWQSERIRVPMAGSPMLLVGTVGNHGPRDPREGRRRRASRELEGP